MDLRALHGARSLSRFTRARRTAIDWAGRTLTIVRVEEATHALYLRDLGYLLREAAVEAKVAVESAAPGEDRDLAIGRQLAYYEVISLMRQEAEAFGIPLVDLALDDIDPERDLLSP